MNTSEQNKFFEELRSKVVDGKLRDVNLIQYGKVFLQPYELPEWMADVEVINRFSVVLIAIPSLKNCPKRVGGHFCLYNCFGFSSLEGAPEYVGGDFYCKVCYDLKSLKGIPPIIKGRVNVSGFTSQQIKQAQQESLQEYLKNNELNKDNIGSVVNTVFGD